MSTPENTIASGALSHLRVLDLTQGICGPYCSKLFAGFGAEVVKIEPPRGDSLRRQGPFVGKKAGPERSIPFLWFNTGKKSITLDLQSSADAEQFRKMVAQADIVLEDSGPYAMSGLGLDFVALSRINPRLIMTSITNFGHTGPYKDFEAEEITLYAMSGLMSATGDSAREPLCSGPALSQLTAGMKAYIATLMAVYRRARTGQGDWVDLSIQESALDNFEIAVAEYLQTGKKAARRNDEHALVPWRIFPCRDGYAAILGGPIRNWLKAAPVFEAPELLEQKLEHMEGRIRHRDDVRRLMQPWMMKNDKKDIFHAGQKLGLAWGYLATLQDVIDSPQTRARDFFGDLEHPDAGTLSMIGAPFRPAKTPWKQQRAPRLGEHTEEILAAWLGSSVKVAQSSEVIKTAAEPSDRQPMAGIRIVDLTHDWAGPHAVRVMADYGAEVIKIEYHARLDGMRGAYLDKINDHARWWEINRNKLTVSLDLHDPDQVHAFKELVKQADVVVENSRPGVYQRMGIGFDDLRKIKPDLIMVSMSAYGATGPESLYAGYGGAIEALSGVQALTAYSRDGDPMRVREVDVTNGVMGTCAIMTALMHRQHTGEGQWVDVSERETSSWLIGEHLLEYTVNGEQTLPLGNRHPVYAPQGCYRTEGNDRWLVLTIRSDYEWAKFCEVAGLADATSDARFATVEGRRKHHDEIDGIIGGWTATQSPRSAMKMLQAAGLAAGMVATTEDIGADEHLLAREWFQICGTATSADSRYPGFPFRFARGGGEFTRRGPDLDADNEAILCERLGLPRQILAAIAAQKLGTAFDME